MELSSKIFNKAFIVLSVIIFIIIAIRAAVVPFCHDETATFFYYIQPGDFLPYTSHIDTNNHILNSFLAWICFHLFGDSPFSLRLPNLFSLAVFIIAVYRLTKSLAHTSSKIILFAGLLVSFHWLSFFDVCRGYGISMAFMTLALSYIPDYIEHKNLVNIIKIYALLDIAICANLMLVIVTLLITALIFLFQLYYRSFFKTWNLLIAITHIGIVLYWVMYSFFIQHVLQQVSFFFPGAGDSYWQITFVTLIHTIVGKQNHLVDMAIICIYLIFMIIFLYFLIKVIKQKQVMPLLYTIFLACMMNGLIIGFYLLKKICGINYPEDRTGMFFYLFFILNVAFIVELIKPRYANIIAAITGVVFITHFMWNLNFRKHSLDMYDIVPKRFYTRLVEEQKNNPQRITIGGNRFRELFYAFMNYRNQGELNLMDIPEDPSDMFMDDDYYIAYKVNRKQYLPYYNEIDTDRDYGFALLKRKQPLARKPAFKFGQQNIEMDEKSEYANLFEIKDTTIKDHSPLLVEFNFKILNADKPLLAWFVIEVDSADGQAACYERIPLNWLRYNWAAMKNNADLTLQTEPLPAKIHRFVCYVWNNKKQHLKMRMDSVKVFHLEGAGSQVDARVNADF